MNISKTKLSLLMLLPFLSFLESSNEKIHRSHFPDGFIFGTATSSFQVEGAYLEDGKSLSNWDVFSHTPGNIVGGANADISADHYHHYMEDIELLHSLGVDAYRFSISWARILPRGRFGPVNQAGLMFYNRIIDNLLLRGIKPFVTIYHHDIPQELEDRFGGFLSPLIQEEYVHFAETCFKNFGDRVKYWITLNEPNICSELGYIRGLFPPGHCLEHFGNCSIVGNSLKEPLLAMHNMLISHAKAAYIYREHFQPKQGGCIGVSIHAYMFEPLNEHELDREAASRALAFDNGWALDPLVKGDYPPEMRRLLGKIMPKFSPDDSKNLKGSIDFIGLNHYSTLYAKDCLHSPCDLGGYAIKGFIYATGEQDGIPIGEKTAMPTFYVVPSGLKKIIDYLRTRYNNKPIFVTENGMSQMSKLTREELLHDVERVKYHEDYLASLAQAIGKGADVRGYFVWTLMDDFEWMRGYSIRFGLHYVDFQTLERIPKLSAKWFASFLSYNIHSNGSEIVMNASSDNSTSSA